MKGKRNSDYQKVSHLIPLRITADLNVDEAKAVDEAVRYDDKSRSELESYSRAMAVLQEAAATPVPEQSPIVGGGGGSLWDRIEPRLGPAGRMRRGGFDGMPTRYLAAACVALIGFAAVNETGWLGFSGQKMHPQVNFVNVPPPGGQATVPQGQLRAVIHFRWMMNERTEIPEMGIDVGRVDRLMQNQLGLTSLNGVLVGKVNAESVGERVGLRPLDCIKAVNGRPVYAPQHFRELLEECKREGEREFHFDVIRRIPVTDSPAPTSNDQSSLWLQAPGDQPILLGADGELRTETFPTNPVV